MNKSRENFYFLFYFLQIFIDIFFSRLGTIVANP